MELVGHPEHKRPDRVEFVKCVQENFRHQYVEGRTREGATLDLLLGNEVGQVTEVSLGEHFGSNDHNSLSFNVVMEKDWTGPQVKVLNWSRANFGAIRQDLAELDR
eukprot:g29281.t1